MSKNILLISPQILKDRTTLHDNIEDKLIYPEIKAAQDMFILPLLGSSLFDKILTDINTDTLAGAYKTLVDDYLIDCLCNYVLSEMPENINHQFTNKGLVGKTTENTVQPSMSDMYTIVGKYKSRAEHYARRAERYLLQNAPTLFPEYINPGTGIDSVYPERETFSNPIYLGEDETCNKSYSEKYQGNRPSC